MPGSTITRRRAGGKRKTRGRRKRTFKKSSKSRLAVDKATPKRHRRKIKRKLGRKTSRKRSAKRRR